MTLEARLRHPVGCTLKDRVAAADLLAKQAEAARDAAEQREYKDGAYLERNRLVALLSKLFPSGKAKTAIEGWDVSWHGCVYIDLPTGQASWHYHESQEYLFVHLPEYTKGWDGHTTDEKYERISAMRLALDVDQAAAEPFKALSDDEILWIAKSHGIDVYACNVLGFYTDLISTSPVQAAVEPVAWMISSPHWSNPMVQVNKPTRLMQHETVAPLYTSPQPNPQAAMRLALSMLHFMNDSGYRLEEYEQCRMDAAIAALEEQV